MATAPDTQAPEPKKPVMKRQVPGYLWALGFLIVAVLGYAAGTYASNGTLFTGGVSQLLGQKELNLTSVQQTYQKLLAEYDGTIDDAALIEGANRGMVEALGDEYTVFLNAQESSAFDDSLTGSIGGGIGLEVGIRNNVPTAVRVLKDNPAEKAGIQVDDVIIAVNDDSTEGKSLNEVVTSIRGEVGTTVKLTVVRAGTEQDVSITRETVNNPSAYGEVVDSVGVLTVTRFDNQTGSLARAVAQDFLSQDVKGVVLDLRGNGGGFVTAAQSVAGIWIDNEPVVIEKRGAEVLDELKATGSSLLKDVPTVVLVNKSSASASEIVAGALRDYDAAQIVGETTFGKGSVQKLVNLMDGATLKVTIARWYTPLGDTISDTGIVPDLKVERTADDINANRDPQLTAAKDTLLSR